MAFLFFGRFVLNFFGISLPVLNIAGGVIVAHTAWGMATASSRVTRAESHEASTRQDISPTPMAMPMLSGPGSIGVIMGLAAHANSRRRRPGDGGWRRGTGSHRVFVLAPGGPLVSRVGPGATGSIHRMFGFLIPAIGAQLGWDGVTEF